MKTSKKNLINLKKDNDSQLFNYVIDDLLDHSSNIDDIIIHMKDILNYGCVSGCVSSLIYYSDTLEFYNKYKDEINSMLYETMQETGIYSIKELLRDFDEEDPLSLDTHNQNLLSWYAYEEITRNILNMLEIEY